MHWKETFGSKWDTFDAITKKACRICINFARGLAQAVTELFHLCNEAHKGQLCRPQFVQKKMEN